MFEGSDNAPFWVSLKTSLAYKESSEKINKLIIPVAATLSSKNILCIIGCIFNGFRILGDHEGLELNQLV
jgi:hypothetical protein